MEAKIQETKRSLSNMNDFIKENENALTSMISAKRQMIGLQEQMSSVQTRLSKIEGDRTIDWNKTATVISIFVAIAACIIAN